MGLSVRRTAPAERSLRPTASGFCVVVHSGVDVFAAPNGVAVERARPLFFAVPPELAPILPVSTTDRRT